MSRHRLGALLLIAALTAGGVLCAPPTSSRDESHPSEVTLLEEQDSGREAGNQTSPSVGAEANTNSDREGGSITTIGSDGTTGKSSDDEPKDSEATTTMATTTTTAGSDMFEFTSHKNTSTFTCDGKVTGYYADVKLNCHVYHFCTQLDGLDGPSYQRMSYLCLEGSYFDQKDLNCVREADLKVPCDKAEAEYERSNKQFDSKEENQPSMSDNLAANLMMNPIARFIAGR